MSKTSNNICVGGVEGKVCMARKQHTCDHYFSHACAGSGVIAKGSLYFTPFGDFHDAFHPYRVCAACYVAVNDREERVRQARLRGFEHGQAEGLAKKHGMPELGLLIPDEIWTDRTLRDEYERAFKEGFESTGEKMTADVEAAARTMDVIEAGGLN